MSALPEQVSVVNVGLPMFADALRAQGVMVQQVDWRIPAGGDLEAVAALRRLYGRRAAAIDEANAEVARRLDEGAPKLVAIKKAFEERGSDAFPGHGHPTPADDELRRLRAENARLRAERDLLKKAAAYFANPPS